MREWEEDWKVQKLGGILERISNGSNEKQYPDQTDGRLPISRIETIAQGEINLDRVKYVASSDKIVQKYLLQKGDILLSHINSDKHLGKVAIVDSEVRLIHGINLLLLRCKNGVDPKFLFYQLRYLGLPQKLPLRSIEI